MNIDFDSDWLDSSVISMKLRQLPELTNHAVENSSGDVLIDRWIPGAPLLISFAFVDWEKLSNFYIFGRSKKLEELSGQPLNRIMLRDRRNLWYLRGVQGLGDSPIQVAEHLKPVIAAMMPSHVWCVGESMGAYAAIMYGVLLNASRIVSFGALSTFSPSFALQYRDMRWHSIMEKLGENPISTTTDLPTLIRQRGFVNPLHMVIGTSAGAQAPEDINLDVMHGQRFAGLPSVRYHYYPDGEHAVTAWLANHGQFDAILMHCLFDVQDPSSLEVLAGKNSVIDKSPVLAFKPDALALETAPISIAPKIGYSIHAITLGAPVLISFSEVDAVTGLPIDFVEERKNLQQIYGQPLNQIVLRDYQQTLLWGRSSTGLKIQDVVDNLRTIVDKMQAKGVICIGKGLGGFAALLIGSLVKADCISVFDPLSIWSTPLAKCWHDNRHQRILSSLDNKLVIQESIDLLPILQEFGGQIIIACSAYGKGQGYDVGSHCAVHAQRLGTLPNAKVFPFPVVDNLVSWMREHQVLEQFLGESVFGRL